MVRRRDSGQARSQAVVNVGISATCTQAALWLADDLTSTQDAGIKDGTIGGAPPAACGDTIAGRHDGRLALQGRVAVETLVLPAPRGGRQYHR